jgi:hypothetical protein
VGREAHAFAPNGVNDHYLATKAERFGTCWIELVLAQVHPTVGCLWEDWCSVPRSGEAVSGATNRGG